MTTDELQALANEILMLDPEQSLIAMKQDREIKDILARGYGEDDEEPEDDYVPAPRNRHILSAEEWNKILE